MRTATTFLVLIFLSLPVLAAGYGPQLIIEGPADGAVLPGNEQRSIVARFEPPVDFAVLGLDAAIEAIGPAGTVELARGDLRSRDAPDRISTIWSLDGVTPGDYRLRVTARAGHLEGSAEVSVTVQPPPVVELYLTALRAGNGGVEATFDAVASSPAGTPIVEYVFAPMVGDVQVADRPRLIYRVPDLGVTYPVSIEARDATGTSTTVARDLHVPLDWYRDVLYTVGDLPGGPLVPEAGYGNDPVPQEKLLKKPKDCGCDRMTITAGDRVARSQLYCVDAVNGFVNNPREFERLLFLQCIGRPDAPAGTCGKNQVAFDCPLGQRVPSKPNELPVSPILSWGFEVVAELSVLSESEKSCPHGQYARGDFTINGFGQGNPLSRPGPPVRRTTLPDGWNGDFTFDVVGGERVPPRKGPAFGPDDYADEDTLVQRNLATIRWYDQPFQSIRQAAVTAANDLEFVSFVRGVGGLTTCWCRFVIDQRFVAGGGIAPANTITIIDGNSCFAGPGVRIGPF